jgi:hypothetical protein
MLPTSSTDHQTHCLSYTWINGVTYNSSTNSPTFTLINSNGCDSLITLDLTINNPTYSSFDAFSCEPYFWELAQSSYSSSGSYPFTLTGSNGCDSIITLNVTIASISEATISDNGQGTLIATGGNVAHWINCSNNSILLGAAGNTYTPVQNGIYAAVFFDFSNSCSDTSNCITVDYMEVTTNNQFNLILYPNPTNDLVTIQFDGNNAHYTIYDAQGKMIQTSTIHSGGTISLKDVQTGVYFFELKTENGNVVKRVVKN